MGNMRVLRALTALEAYNACPSPDCKTAFLRKLRGVRIANRRELARLL